MKISTLFWMIGLGVVLLMGAGVLRLMARKEITDEEFELGTRRPSLLRAGLQEFQGFLEPEKRAAFKAVQEEKQKSERSVPGELPKPVL